MLALKSMGLRMLVKLSTSASACNNESLNAIEDLN